MTGSAPFDLASGRFIDQGRGVQLSHLNAVFGAVEVSAELIRLLDVPGYRAAWLDYCRWYNAPQVAYLARFGPPFGPRNLREGHSRLTAYAAFEEARDQSLEELRVRLAERGVAASSSALSRFFHRHGMTRKKDRTRGRTGPPGRPEQASRLVLGAARPRSCEARVHRRDLDRDEHGAHARAQRARRTTAHGLPARSP
jgi:hypothetical protein